MVLFEGWMLGFKPLPVEVVQAVDPQVNFIYKCLGILFIQVIFFLWYLTINCSLSLHFFLRQLEIVNKNLEAYYDAWDKFVKAWVVIKIQDPSCVYQWRLQVAC